MPVFFAPLPCSLAITCTLVLVGLAVRLRTLCTQCQERNNVLRSELAALDMLRDSLIHEEKALKDEETASKDARKQLLLILRDRNEKELLLLNDESRPAKKATSAIKSDTALIRGRSEELQNVFDREHAPIYARHDVSTRLYVMKSTACLDAAQRKKQRREDRLQYLRGETSRQRNEVGALLEEKRTAEERSKFLLESEEQDDDEVVEIASIIKHVLSKKLTLRAELGKTQDILEVATENRDMWERRCVGNE